MAAPQGRVRGGHRDIREAFRGRPTAKGSGKKIGELQEQLDEMKEEDQQQQQQHHHHQRGENNERIEGGNSE